MRLSQKTRSRAGSPKKIQLKLDTLPDEQPDSPQATLANTGAARHTAHGRCSTPRRDHARAPGHHRGPAGGLQPRHRVRHDTEKHPDRLVQGELHLQPCKYTGRLRHTGCCRRTSNSAPARTCRTSKGLLPSPNTACGTLTLSHTVPGRLNCYSAAALTRRKKKGSLGWPCHCTHILAQSDAQVWTSAPHPRHSELPQKLAAELEA